MAAWESWYSSWGLRISCSPLARVHGALHVLVLTPVGQNLPPSPLLKPAPGSPPPAAPRSAAP